MNKSFKQLVAKYMVMITMGVTGIISSVHLVMFFICLLGILAGEAVLGMAFRSLATAVIFAVSVAMCAAWLEAHGYWKPERSAHER